MKYIDPLSNIVKDKSPSTWDLMKQTAKSPQEIKGIRDTVNSHVRSMGNTKFVTPDEIKYLDKKEENKPFAVVQDSGTAYPDSMITEPGPTTVPEIPVTEIIKNMADLKLLAEQKNWDYRYGKGGIPSLKRPE